MVLKAKDTMTETVVTVRQLLVYLFLEFVHLLTGDTFGSCSCIKYFSLEFPCQRTISTFTVYTYQPLTGIIQLNGPQVAEKE